MFGTLVNSDRGHARASVLGLASLIVAIGAFVVPASYVTVTNSIPFSDGFSRTTSDGWGKTAQSESYTYPWGVEGGVLSTNGTAGVIKLARGTGVLVDSNVSVADATVSAAYGVEVIPLMGNGISPTLHVRSGSSGAYRLVTRIGTGGVVQARLDRIDGNLKVTPLSVAEAPWTIEALERVTATLTVTGTNPVRLKGTVRSARGEAFELAASDGNAGRITSKGSVALETYLSEETAPIRLFVDDFNVTSLSAAIAAPQPTLTPGGVTALGDAGSLPLGEASYPVPSGAVFVSPGGSDTNAGTISAPLRTITKATSVTPAGGTIVLRAGAYHETLTMPGHKALTIQNYPGEAAWMDGSSAVTGWVKSGSVWVKSGWTPEFDSSPTYTRGAPDGTAVGLAVHQPRLPDGRPSRHGVRQWCGVAAGVEPERCHGWHVLRRLQHRPARDRAATRPGRASAPATSAVQP